MTNTIDKLLASVLFVGLSLALVIEVGNLIGFGSHEYYLHHPDYPDGEQFRRDVNSGFAMLLFFTLTTAVLLMVVLVAKRRNNKLMFYQAALLTFLFALFLPIRTMMNGLIFTGVAIALIILGIVALVVMRIVQERNVPNEN